MVFFKGCKGGLGAQDVWPPWCYCCNFPQTSYVLSSQRRQPHPPVYIEESQIPSYCSSAKLRGSARSRNESSPTLLKCLDNRIDETSFKRFFFFDEKSISLIGSKNPVKYKQSVTKINLTYCNLTNFCGSFLRSCNHNNNIAQFSKICQNIEKTLKISLILQKYQI